MNEVVSKDFCGNPLIYLCRDGYGNLKKKMRGQLVEYIRDELTLSWPAERIIGRVVIEGSTFPLGTVMMEGGRKRRS
jgi:hypothetical protein